MGMQAFETVQEIVLVVDADTELAHWRGQFRELPHCRYLRWDDVKPALKLGIDACLKANGRDLTQMLDELEIRYRRVGETSRLDWQQARDVVAAAWMRIWDQHASGASASASSASAVLASQRPVLGLRAR